MAAQPSKGVDIRDAFFDVIYQAAARDRRVLVLADDQGAFGIEKLKRDCPKQFINIGIAEQNIINLAAGLATGGLRPIVYGITNFMSLRCCEQIAVSLCFPRLPVVIVASGGGLTYASDGPTHHALQDIGVLRTMPHLTIYNPSDAALTTACAHACLAATGPTYVRIEKGVLPALHAGHGCVERGFAPIGEGQDALIVSTGFLVHEAVRTASRLRESGVGVAVLDLFRLKPVDGVALAGVLREYRHVIVMEEQTPCGGAADIVARTAAEAGLPLRLKTISLPDRPCYRYGSREWLHREFGLNAEQAAAAIASWMASAGPREPGVR